MDNLKYFTAILAQCFNSTTPHLQSVSTSSFWWLLPVPLTWWRNMCMVPNAIYWNSKLPKKREQECKPAKIHTQNMTLSFVQLLVKAKKWNYQVAMMVYGVHEKTKNMTWKRDIFRAFMIVCSLFLWDILWTEFPTSCWSDISLSLLKIVNLLKVL